MSENEMRSYLMETAKHVDFFQKYEKAQSLRSNPLLDWMDKHVVFDPGVAAVIGTCKAGKGGGNFYDKYSEWMYPSYAEFCRSCNVGFVGRSRFEVLFFDICKHQLKLNVFAKSEGRGIKIINAALRDSNLTKYERYPSVVEVSANPEKYFELYGMNPSINNAEAVSD
jgi:hypothetical protein